MSLDARQIALVLKTSHLFKPLSDEEIELVIAAGDLIEVEEGDVIFEQDSASRHFFFILEGQAQITRTVHGFEEFISLLQSADYFGEEMLGVGKTRKTRAVAAAPGILLRFSPESLTPLAKQIEHLNVELGLIRDSFRLNLRTYLDWCDEDETVYYIARKHNIFMLLRLALPAFSALMVLLVLGVLALMGMFNMWTAIVAGVLLGVSVLWGLWGWNDWANDYYIVTDRRVVFLEKVLFLYDSRQESPLDAVLSMSQNSDQVGRILSYGNIAIKSYTGTIFWPRIDSPPWVIGMIEEYRGRANVMKRKEEARQLQQTLRKRLGFPTQTAAPRAAPPPPPARPVGGLRERLADVFVMRIEKNGVITYRTHWFILLGRILIPSLLLLLILFLPILVLITKLPISGGVVLMIMIILFLGVGTWWLYNYLDWRNDQYIITSDQIMDVDKKPLGRENKSVAPIKNILNIEYKRLGLLGLVLNYGTVYIRVGEATLTFDNVYKPSEVQHELFNRFTEVSSREKQREAQAERQRITEMIEAYHIVIEEERKARQSAQSGEESG